MPGVYGFKEDISLLQVIASAGGLTPGHGPFIYVLRAIKTQSDPKIDAESYAFMAKAPLAEKQHFGALSGARYDVLRVSTNGILNNRFAEELKFGSGGIVNVPHGVVFFVTGEVHTPGSRIRQRRRRLDFVAIRLERSLRNCFGVVTRH